MNNEPVAWLSPDGKVSDTQGKLFYIPLYTHPVKELSNPVAWRSQDPDGYWIVYQAPVEGAEPLYTGFKELTDEEIIAVGNAVVNHIDSNEGWIEFAKAILRKAQEK